MQNKISAIVNYVTKIYINPMELNRKAQLSAQMLTCIQASINDECEIKVVTRRDNLDIKVKKKNHTVNVPSGKLYLRIMMSRINIDSTVSNIRNTVSELGNYMASIHSNGSIWRLRSNTQLL